MQNKFYESPKIDISREKKYQSTMPDQHYHNGYEIFYLVSGSISYFIEDKIYPVSAGMLLFININEIHKLINNSNEPFERITLVFKKEFLDDLFPGNHSFDVLTSFLSGKNMLPLSGQEQRFLERLFDKMIHEFTKQPAGYEYYLKTLLFELLIFIYRKSDTDTNERIDNSAMNEKIAQIVNYINHHYQLPHTVNDIARRFYISPSYFCKLFRDNTGFTFIEYVNNVRVKEARNLLLHSRLKVTEISQRVGFESQTHFGRIFKEMTGHSPLKFRQSFGNGAAAREIKE